MAIKKIVDSTQLDADLAGVADAIRAKSGGSADLAFPSGFVSEIQAIPTGGGGGSTAIEVSEFIGNIYYIDAADGELKMQASSLSQNVPSGSMVVLLWSGAKPPDGAITVNLTKIYTVSLGSRASYMYVDFFIAS